MLSGIRATVMAAGAAVLLASAAFGQDIPQAKMTKAGLYLSAVEAADLLADPSVVFIDVRTRSEVAFLGLPTRVNVHIPYMEMPAMADFSVDKKEYRLEINPDFPLVFREYAEEHGITSGTPIVLICRSGTRSARAADLLNEMGFARVYSVIDGYEGDKLAEGPQKGQRLMNGWKNAGLAWSYSIDPAQVYPEDRP